ncbi:MAG: HAMP domain-containing protein [Pararhodobacter sp.]|nr:HAMP domain-containing protein [Pararhodobacter sp.]
MSAFLKSFLPRGLYSRAALILLVPVVSLLMVASYAVIQRHYEGMTRQMTDSFSRTVSYIVDTLDAAPDAESAAREAQRLGAAFGLEIALGDTPPEPGPEDRPGAFDLSGRMVVTQLRATLGGLQAIRLEGSEVHLWLQSSQGPVALRFRANRVSPRNPHQLLVVVLLSGALLGAIGFVFLKNQMRPIRRLALAAEAFGRGQSLPYSPSGAREVRAAGQAFLEMRARIEQHIEQRTLMLSGVSHDLRTPLTRMRLALSMMEDEPEAAALMEDVAQMEALIDRFLDFVRNEAGEAESMSDLRALVVERVELAARGGQPVVLAGADRGETDGQTPLMLPLRPQLFARALDNLIDNALRYGKRAEIRIEAAPGAVCVLVEDDGPGIAPEARALATRPFVRLDAARGASRGGGVGLGLAIAADAMRSHGGRLELDGSPRLGGLMARLVLPDRRGNGQSEI